MALLSGADPDFVAPLRLKIQNKFPILGDGKKMGGGRLGVVFLTSKEGKARAVRDGQPLLHLHLPPPPQVATPLNISLLFY